MPFQFKVCCNLYKSVIWREFRWVYVYRYSISIKSTRSTPIQHPHKRYSLKKYKIWVIFFSYEPRCIYCEPIWDLHFFNPFFNMIILELWNVDLIHETQVKVPISIPRQLLCWLYICLKLLAFFAVIWWQWTLAGQMLWAQYSYGMVYHN